MSRNELNRERADYGIDAPYVIRYLVLHGLACTLLAMAWSPLRWLYSPAISFLATAAVWYGCSRFAKPRFRDKLLAHLPLNGDEIVLDVGCGSGLLLVGVAKRLDTGRAVGVDLWRKADLSNTGRDVALCNARIEGVSERVEIEEGDARQLPFEEGRFAAVVSLNVLHNISEREGREKALVEIVRVLKPGGRLLICDFRNVGNYVHALRATGVNDARKEFISWMLVIPIFAAVGTKPSE